MNAGIGLKWRQINCMLHIFFFKAISALDTEMKLMCIFSSVKQQHLPTCQISPLIRHLYTIGKQKCVMYQLMMMYSWTPSSGHDSSERSA